MNVTEIDTVNRKNFTVIANVIESCTENFFSLPPHLCDVSPTFSLIFCVPNLNARNSIYYLFLM